MRIPACLAAPALMLLAQGCAPSPAAPPPASSGRVGATAVTPTILISIDGFRPDYLDRGVTPVMSRLAAGGLRASMRPSFPSKTFPNHYTLVTGLRPDRNGIVANKMEDARRPGETFTMASDDPFWWNEATPLWVDAERAGIRTATVFWPGSNVAVGGTRAAAWPYETTGGTRPSDWQQYNEAIGDTQRVNAVLDMLRRPAAIRPAFLTLYYEAVDTAGHQYGPRDPRTAQAVARVDASIGMLVEGLKAQGIAANIVIVADHGMAETSSDRVVALDTIADRADYRVIESGPYAALAAVPGRERALEAALLRRHAHVQCWRKAEIPARFHYGRNPRVPPYLCLAEDGWLINESAPKAAFTGGNHGYDPAAPDMAAIFIGYGPAFRRGGTVAPFDNVDVYPLLRRLIGLPPAGDKDGSAATFAAVTDTP